MHESGGTAQYVFTEIIVPENFNCLKPVVRYDLNIIALIGTRDRQMSTDSNIENLNTHALK